LDFLFFMGFGFSIFFFGFWVCVFGRLKASNKSYEKSSLKYETCSSFTSWSSRSLSLPFCCLVSEVALKPGCCWVVWVRCCRFLQKPLVKASCAMSLLQRGYPWGCPWRGGWSLSCDCAICYCQRESEKKHARHIIYVDAKIFGQDFSLWKHKIIKRL